MNPKIDAATTRLISEYDRYYRHELRI